MYHAPCVVVLECSKKQWFVKTSPRDIAPVLFECPCRFSRFIQVSGVATSLFKIYSSFGPSRRNVIFSTTSTNFFVPRGSTCCIFENAEIGLLAWQWAKRDPYETRKQNIPTLNIVRPRCVGGKLSILLKNKSFLFRNINIYISTWGIHVFKKKRAPAARRRRAAGLLLVVTFYNPYFFQS